jgi:hypothetical protein
MQTKSVAWWLWLIPIVILLIAVARVPYGYYTFTRIVVCGSAAFLAFSSWADGGLNKGWAVIFALIAVLFNPLIPVYLKRETWIYFDFGVASIFAAHLGLARLRGIQTSEAKGRL